MFNVLSIAPKWGASAIVGILTVISVTKGNAAPACGELTLAGERARMTKLLSATGYSSEQTSFLIRGYRAAFYPFPAASMTPEAKTCGRMAIQALVLNCTGSMLKSSLAETSDPDAMKAVSYWGRKKLAVRELLFIGLFHACQAAARERFERR
ncbi:hypothetical protein [Mesorhizobium retamae]|uniref:Uncharacterized protein n=1 Tax=Mesorhizobium retamae TaxID=2912854 RepID=A0ABS9QIQ4_9HYPH|nr:hypothetical protein [Mesorhizobium sp. IRAMC:0171]MCG7507295.1 hypothetical protein [Mesorhizobium sp. IRAMC:0171]